MIGGRKERKFIFCSKHGDVGERNINVTLTGFTPENGVNYCLICFNDLLSRECCVLKERPLDTKEQGDVKPEICDFAGEKKCGYVRKCIGEECSIHPLHKKYVEKLKPCSK